MSSAFFALVLSGVFIVWYASEKTLSIHSIYTRRREAFYWAVVHDGLRSRHGGG